MVSRCCVSVTMSATSESANMTAWRQRQFSDCTYSSTSVYNGGRNTRPRSASATRPRTLSALVKGPRSDSSGSSSLVSQEGSSSMAVSMEKRMCRRGITSSVGGNERIITGLCSMRIARNSSAL